MKKLLLLMLVGGALVFNSCSKTGPQGPQGNANVIGSSAFTVSSWSQTGSSYYASFSDPDITNDIVNTGAVEVYKLYVSSNGSTSWTNLPDVDGVTSTVYNFYSGGFDIYIQNSDGSLPAFPGSVTFRTVVISSSLRQAHPNTNWKNYNEAMQALSTPATAATK